MSEPDPDPLPEDIIIRLLEGVERNATQLVTHPERHFSSLHGVRSSQIAALEARDELVRANERLRRTNDRLWNKLSEVRPVEAEQSQSA